MTIEGGYTPDCASRVIDPTNTTLDGEENGVVLALSAPGVASNFVIDGVTFQNGSVTGDINGGGLFINKSGIVFIKNTLIRDNSTKGRGGGIYIYGPDVVLENNNITNNSAYVAGGAWIRGGTVELNNNIIGDNLAWETGGCYINCSSTTLKNNTIAYNTANQYGGLDIASANINLSNNSIKNNSGNAGGGAVLNGGNIAIANNIISFNTSSKFAGGLKLGIESEGSLFFTNNTICYNSANEWSGGIYLESADESDVVNIYNNIIFNNSAIEGADLYLTNDRNNNYIPATVNLFNNNFNQSAAGTYIQIPFSIDPSNLKNEDPLFVDPVNGDFHLTKESPCRDAGDNDAPELPDTDIDGELRILDGFVDIGADEYSAPPCRADFDGDNFFDDTDLNILSFAMGEIDCTWWPVLCVCDTDGDDDVDGVDLKVLISEFGRSDCP